MTDPKTGSAKPPLETLLAYHFGATSDEEREQVDAHLLACTGCLRAYLRLKHHVERGAARGARPSEAVRARIRADVEAIVRPSGAARVREVLRRPLPLYQALAVAAVAAGIAVGLPSITRSIVRPSASHSIRVDTSEPLAASQGID
jgi:anti-sigma factor RsiW